MDNIYKIDRYHLLKEKAHELLKQSTNKNPFVLAKILGIDIQICHLDLEGFWHDKTIYINNKLDLYSQKIICAHEIGHYLLHRNISSFELFDTNTCDITEFEANLFVREIMPQVFSRVSMDNFEHVSDFNRFVKSQLKYIE